MLALFNQLLFSVMVAWVSFNSRPDIHIFLKDTATPAQIEQLQQKIEAEEGVIEVTYISQEEAYQAYRNSIIDDPLLLEMVTPDIMPASLEVYVDTAEAKNKVIDIAKQTRYVDETY
jgi:cell division protein FtsX